MGAKEDLRSVMEEKAAALRAKQEASLHKHESASAEETPISAGAKAQVEASAQEGFLGAAARTLEETSPEGDAPSEISDVGLDFDFLNFDPTDFIPHLKRCGMSDAEVAHLTENFALRWVCTKREKFDKRIWQGWEIINVGGQTITRGDLIACRLPKVKADAMNRQLRQRMELRRNAPMKRFEQEVGPLTAGGQFSTFDDNSGPRIRK